MGSSLPNIYCDKCLQVCRVLFEPQCHPTPSGGLNCYKIGGKSFVGNIANYIKAVEAFKDKATGQTPAPITKKNPDLNFTPEFNWPRKKYKLTSAIESQCDHGTVANTLHADLKVLGFAACKTSKIDLFLADAGGTSRI